MTFQTLLHLFLTLSSGRLVASPNGGADSMELPHQLRPAIAIDTILTPAPTSAWTTPITPCYQLTNTISDIVSARVLVQVFDEHQRSVYAHTDIVPLIGGFQHCIVVSDPFSLSVAGRYTCVIRVTENGVWAGRSIDTSRFVWGELGVAQPALPGRNTVSYPDGGFSSYIAASSGGELQLCMSSHRNTHVTVHIYDVVGRSVAVPLVHTLIGSGQLQLSLSTLHLPPGEYLCDQLVEAEAGPDQHVLLRFSVGR